MKIFYLSSILFLITCFVALGSIDADEETIFLPFPDLTRDLEPEKFHDNSNAIDLEAQKKSSSNSNDLDSTMNAIPKTQSDDKVSNSNIKNSKTQTNSNSKISNSSSNTKSSLSKNSNSTKNQKVATAKTSKVPNSANSEYSTTAKATDKTKIASSEFGDFSDFPTSDEDKEAFRKAMESVRSIESKDPAKAISEYEKLLTKFMNPPTVARIRIYMAWNYFHRKQFQDSLIQVLEILDNPDILEGREYPIALYLAGRIHEEKWNGAIKNSALTYYKLFLGYHKKGLSNFTESRFADEIKKRFENDRSLRADRII
ncbi:tetratricopeptide repeat protein [Leptospira sp. GIMC2001]|uniref:tetratricopeptide repeat protein n=1 Tax=Leptospira sp. GIMC2001 TaxID=1513297 RepID=UPI0023490305|nr:hypothetical protein [Leptospira sp. GIMC2001]WCL50413.1 hypothetical protein O4O04_06225 [Leptospira sp. GIMC2001]